jgi:glutaredoxin 2
MLPLQQPILLAGGSLPALNVFHNPVWMSGKPEETQVNQVQNLERLNMLNKQLDEELNKYKPLMNNQQAYNQNFSCKKLKYFLLSFFILLVKILVQQANLNVQPSMSVQGQHNIAKKETFGYPKFMQVSSKIFLIR